MTDLSAFPITQRWPARHPDRIQLYSLPTPNGVKASIMLEETGLAYEPHLIDITRNGGPSSRWNAATSALRFLTAVPPCSTRPARPKTVARNSAMGSVISRN